MGKRIGVVTIGASPRPDGLVTEISQVLGEGFELVEAGALDGLPRPRIEAMAPEAGDYLLVTIMNDGSWVRIAKKHILPLVQQRIDEMNDRNVDLILLMCTGAFPEFRSKKYLVKPQPILYNLVKGIAQGGRVGVMTPLPEQVEQAKAKWNEIGVDVVVTSATPYGDVSLIDRAATELSQAQVDLIVMDCFGYTLAMKETVKRLTGKPVVLARSALARVVGELA